MQAIVGTLLSLTLFFAVNIFAAYKVGDSHQRSLASARASAKPDPWQPTLAPRSPLVAPAARRGPVVAKPAVKSPAAKEALAVFKGRCVACHGATGHGDGVAGKALKPSPRNYTDKAWQKSVTDAHIAKVIVHGGPSVGKSPLMPPQPDLAAKPAVLGELVKIVRAFGK